MGHGGVGQAVTDPGSIRSNACTYVIDNEQRGDEGVDGNEGKAFLEFQVKPCADRTGVGNAKANPRQGLYIMCHLCCGDSSIDVKLLIDSGATASLLDEQLYQSIPENLRPPLSRVDVRITLANGSVQQCLGQTSIPLKIGGAWHSANFLVGSWSDPAILGMAELQSLGLSIDFEGMVVTKNDHWIPTHDQGGRWVSRKVFVRKSTVIPAQSQSIVEGRVTASQTKTEMETSVVSMLEPDISIWDKYGVVPMCTMYKLNDSTVPVVIHNPFDAEVKLNPGTLLGQLVDPENPKANGDWLMEELATETARSAVQTEGTDSEADLPSHLTDLWKRSIELLNESQREEFHQLLITFQDIFSEHNYDIGCTHLLEFAIDTGTQVPIKQVPRRMNPQAAKAADEIIGELLLHKLIEPSESPWASPIVMVKRKDGRFRMCIDFREVNKVTLNKEAWPLPRIDDTLDSLSGAKYFCTTDLTAGYWQVPMAEGSKWQTAFVHRSGLYQWNRKPFGVTDGPGKFSRMMAIHFKDMINKSCQVFLDDVIIFGKTIEETLSHYKEFCTRIRAANLKLKPAKCSLFQTQVSFLGHIVSERGVATDPEKVSAVQTWPTPKSRKQVRSFLGLIGYYRRFVPQCSTLAKPLTELTSPSVPFAWSKEREVAFQQLKESLLQAPILGYPREDGGQFILDTDASDVGIGGVLSQLQNDEEVVISYGSRTLSPAERNYCVTRRELLAIVYHVRMYKSYLLGRHFLIRTDHSSLKYLHRFKEPEGQLARWIDFLQPFQFEIQFRPGIKHGNADALSRRPDYCDGKKCYCQPFADLIYEPPVRMESYGLVDVAVQATPTASSSEQILQCCGVKSMPSRTVEFRSLHTQTSNSSCTVHSGWRSHQKNVGGVTLFFHNQTPLSNFYTCKFVGPNGEVYNGNEQYYQSAKALASGDQPAYDDIMSMNDPRMMKARTRKLKGLKLHEWREMYGADILEEGCRLKFDQNDELADHLLNTTEEVIGEASPYDYYYGIGMSMDHPDAVNPTKWKGKNVMGQILQRVRYGLRVKQGLVERVRAVTLRPLWTLEEVCKAQENDLDIKPILDLIKEGVKKPDWAQVSTLSARSKLLILEWDRLSLQDGVLKRLYIQPNEDIEWYQLVLPRQLVDIVLPLAHDSATSGHLAIDRTKTRLQARFWWPKQTEDVQRYIQSCLACQQRKGPPKRARAPLQKYLVGVVGERVASDIMGPFSETEAGYSYIIVFIDYFSKYAVAVALADITAVSVANAFLERWVSYFGIPLEFHSDQGSQYCGEVMVGLCRLLGISKTRTTPLRPQGDGLAERLNRTICDMLNCVGAECPFSWDVILPMVIMAYNSSVQESTRETPNAVVYGRQVTLPISLLDPAGDAAVKIKAESSSEYVLQLQRQMELVHHKVRERLQKAALKQERSYNNRLNYREYSVGDTVLYWYPVKGKSPKESYFKWTGPFVVVECLSSTVYRIQKTARAKSLVVNHDALKPVKLRELVETAWAQGVSKKRECVSSEQAEEVLLGQGKPGEMGRRPRRLVKAPDKYGEWIFET